MDRERPEAGGSPSLHGHAGGRAPLWRDVRVLRVLFQLAFLAGVALLAGLLYANMTRGLQNLGLSISFHFLDMEAGFPIAEGIVYEPSDPYRRAFLVGFVNTLRVAVTGIALATLVGIVVGVARLSGNWLVRNLAALYVEIFRNTPLLLQILFWYSAVILKMPPVRQSLVLFDHVFISQRGIYLPRPLPTEAFGGWLYFLAAALVAAAAVYALRWRQLRRQDRPGFPSAWAAPVFLGVALAGWFLVPSPPLALEIPVLRGFNFRGGAYLSPEFTALLLALVVYTGAFMAEIVRGGIQSVQRGQQEAAMAIGLRSPAVMYLVILPQALRVIVPPMTSQYLNLTKNSSLAVAMGYPDLFNVSKTIMNQTGQSIPVFMLVMAAYLSFSLITSLFMNVYNRRVRLVER